MTTQGRRRHGACLVRLRDNCPFRKLRKCRCRSQTDVNGPAGPPGAPAGDVTRPPGPHHAEETSAMDTDAAYQAGPSYPSMHLDSPPFPGPSSLNSVGVPQNHRSVPSDCGMELDNDVDPETGERALG